MQNTNRLHDISQTGRCYLTIDLGGTKTAIAVGFDNGEIAGRSEFPTSRPEETIPKIVELSVPLIQKHKPVAAGISCGGPVRSREGLVLGPPNMDRWDHVEIVSILNKSLGLETYLENDANAGALAEWIYGAGRGFENLIFLTCGTGNGAGLILDGKLYRGKQDSAGEIGHIRMEDDGPVGFHKAGSFEGFASGGGLRQIAMNALSEPHPSSRLDKIDVEGITSKDVGEAALAGDEFARELITMSGRYLGRGLAILIDILNPECIVIGSIYARNEKLFKPHVERMLKEEAIPAALEVCRIVPAKLGDSIGDYAALSVALKK